jgi:hypothetical protein
MRQERVHEKHPLHLSACLGDNLYNQPMIEERRCWFQDYRNVKGHVAKHLFTVGGWFGWVASSVL